MKKRVEWSEIIDGFRGFENLAIEYVKDTYKNDTWKKTQETRDGNKDGFAVVMGYQSDENTTTYWWMEAKYTHKEKKLTRYRLDATIVSAILEGNVSQVIFVTNSIINTKIIADIRLTLLKSINCKKVDFCFKETLEYWLCQNPNIYHKYFDDKDAQLEEPDLFITQEIDYYLSATENICYSESLHQLFMGETYTAYFSLFSPRNTVLTLRVNSDIKGVVICSDRRIEIKRGENQIKFCFKIEPNYHSKKNNNIIPVLKFKLGDMDLLSYNPIIPIKSREIYLNIPVHNSIIKNLTASYKKFCDKNNLTLSVITGDSGVGKTHLLNDFIKRTLLIEEPIFFGSFEESSIINSKLLIKLLTYIILPYVDPNLIDVEYINQIQNGDIRDLLSELYALYNDYEELCKYFGTISSEQLLLPLNISINKRVIILDNTQNLNENSLHFLIQLLLCISKKNLPVYTILSGQPTFTNTDAYNFLKKVHVINSYELNLSPNDIIECLPSNFADNFKVLAKNSSLPGMSIIELFIYAQYILEENEQIDNFDNFIFSFRTFQRSAILEKAIIKKFSYLFEMHPETEQLCNKIYWSFKPIKYDTKYEENQSLTKLLEAGLVKYTLNGEILPYHDIYKKFYRQHYRLLEWEDLEHNCNNIEYLRGSIENNHRQELINTIQAIIDLFSKKQYYTILYILAGVFETNQKLSLKSELPEELYYKLFLIYGLAAHQQSTEVSCKEIFEEIFEDTNNSLYIDLLNISLAAAYELCVISYESLDYKNAKVIGKTIESQVRKIQLMNAEDLDIKRSISFHDVEVIRQLIETDMTDDDMYKEYKLRANNMEKYNFEYRYESFRARYALSTCTKNIDLCISLLEEGKESIELKYGKNDKHFLWCSFYYHFYSLTSKNDFSHLPKMLNIHEKMRVNQYGNYRKKLYAIAAYFYSQNDMVNGDKFLFMDSFFGINKRKRYEAFYYETLALRDILLGNSFSAIEYLKKANNIFDNLSTYQKVIAHNISMIEKNLFDSMRITFWFGETMKQDFYYIDSRSAW